MLSAHKPASLSEIIGNTQAISQILQWAERWQKGSPQKPLLLWGPPGTGKTAIAHALAAQFGWEMLEFNSSENRDESVIKSVVSASLNFGSLYGKKRLILIDDVDAISASEDKGGISALAPILASPAQPIILTALDLYDKKIQPIRSVCQPIQLRRAYPSTVAKFLSGIAAKHKIKITQEQISAIASNCAGDVRAALNDLEARNFSSARDIQKGIFESLLQIFSAEDYSTARKAAFFADVDHDTLKLWIAHNIPICYSKPFEIADAYESLSKADVFDGRISRNQYYGYLRYSTDLASCGVAVAKLAPIASCRLEFPSFLKEMSATKSKRALRKSILKKVGKACHCGPSAAQSYLWILFPLAAKGKIPPEFGFSEEEKEFLSK
ncbi:MAG: replication factor C large subunit [Candidatus Micrarchaeota archaeon]|nr:replication factor C large subunit [Candidatus Micrarchaeota archaeon]